MWKNIVEPDRPQMIIWRKGIAFWITMATNTHSEYLILWLSHNHNQFTNTLRRYVIRILPVLFNCSDSAYRNKVTFIHVSKAMTNWFTHYWQAYSFWCTAVHPSSRRWIMGAETHIFLTYLLTPWRRVLLEKLTSL